MERVVSKGSVCVQVNDDLGHFFQTKKGLRQGDPLSRILFNLVADMLAVLIERSKGMGFLDGLVPHLVEDGLSILQYADTTRNYLICDAFSATFSENITNVHCNPKHCDDFFNSSRFYDVFLFFVTDVH
jgi:hypothetical protein